VVPAPAVPAMTSEGGFVWNHLPHNLFFNMWLATIHASCLSIKCVRLHDGISSMLRGMSIASGKHLLLALANHLGLDLACIVEKKSSTQSFSRDVSDLNLVQDVLENMDRDERHTYKMFREKVASHGHFVKRRQWAHWF